MTLRKIYLLQCPDSTRSQTVENSNLHAEIVIYAVLKAYVLREIGTTLLPLVRRFIKVHDSQVLFQVSVPPLVLLSMAICVSFADLKIVQIRSSTTTCACRDLAECKKWQRRVTGAQMATGMACLLSSIISGREEDHRWRVLQ